TLTTQRTHSFNRVLRGQAQAPVSGQEGVAQTAAAIEEEDGRPREVAAMRVGAAMTQSERVDQLEARIAQEREAELLFRRDLAKLVRRVLRDDDDLAAGRANLFECVLQGPQLADAERSPVAAEEREQQRPPRESARRRFAAQVERRPVNRGQRDVGEV